MIFDFPASELPPDYRLSPIETRVKMMIPIILPKLDPAVPPPGELDAADGLYTLALHFIAADFQAMGWLTTLSDAIDAAKAKVPLAKLTRVKVQLVIATMADFPEDARWPVTQAQMRARFYEVYGDVTLPLLDAQLFKQMAVEAAFHNNANFPQGKENWN